MAVEQYIDAEAVGRAKERVLTPRTFREAARVLECMCDPTRLQIVRALRADALAVSDLARVIGRSRSATSQHLRVLRECAAVRRERSGNVVRYRLSDDVTAEVLEAVSSAFDLLAPATGRE